MIRTIQTYQKNITDSFKAHPRRYVVLGIVLFGVAFAAALLWPRTIEFSYAGKTCFYQPTLAPGFLRSRSDVYRLEADQKLIIGGVTIAAANMCVVPTAPPKAGQEVARLSLGGSFLSKSYYIVAPPVPEPATASATNKPLPTSRALIVPLSAEDGVFTYKIAAGGKESQCTSKKKQLSCDVPGLDLRQGTSYDLRIDRYFNGKRTSMSTASHKVATLTATAVTAVSIKEGETVYAKPRSIELLADKDIASASVRLLKADGDKQTEIPVKMMREGKKLTVTWDNDLARQATYELAADTVIGQDGSGLDGAYKVRFVTSGGPKVKSVSVGSYKVPLGATAVLTFDQPLLDTQDVASVITATGGAVVTGKKGNQAMVSFANVPRCGSVRIAVTDALKSSYEITGGSSWQYDTRTMCQTIGSIGTSVKGRSITSYSFGSGSSTILYTGSIHGNESSTRSLMLRWIDELEARPGQISSGKTIVVIPVINPDGYASGTRVNARNVDLNRNFSTSDWKSDITTVSNTPFPGGGGPSSLSEPESQALARYVARIRPSLVLSYHSIGGLVAANQAGDSGARANSYARLSGYANTTGSSDTFEYGISGTADDYYGEKLGVPSVLVELGSHSDPQFTRNREAMWAMMR